MQVTIGHFLMPLLGIGAGALLLYTGVRGGWGAIWTATGAFFLTGAAGMLIIALSWVLPGRVGALLRHSVVRLLILCAILGMLLVTVVIGIKTRMGLL